MNEIELANKNKCTGCEACVNVCNQNAISMKEDERGFRYPQINYLLCKKCGLCKNICPELNSSDVKINNNIISYAAVNNCKSVLMAGSSGSVFFELAKELINDGGIVCGCAWDSSDSVKHIFVSEVGDIKKLLKSKYLQSEIGLIFRYVKKNLEDGRKVLFSGTPCQVAGLKTFLRKDYDRLICIDIVCHGVPNRRVFSEFINLLERREGGKISSYCFRDKIKGIGNYATSFVVGNRKKVRQWTLLSYGYLFMKGYLARDCCYSCNYAQKGRVGDITLGDFWGIEKIDNSFNIDEGVSAVIINTDIGNGLFDKVKKQFKYRKVPYNKICENNDQLKFSVIKPPKRDFLWEKYKCEGYKAFEQFYKSKALFLRTKSLIRLLLLNKK